MPFIPHKQQLLPASCTRPPQSRAILICHETVWSHCAQNGCHTWDHLDSWVVNVLSKWENRSIKIVQRAVSTDISSCLSLGTLDEYFPNVTTKPIFLNGAFSSSCCVNYFLCMLCWEFFEDHTPSYHSQNIT